MVPCTAVAPEAVDGVVPVTPIPVLDAPVTPGPLVEVPLAPAPLVEVPPTPVPLGEVPCTPVPVPVVLLITPYTAIAAAAVPFWLARTAAALCAVAWMPKPLAVLVALTAGVEVELVKVPGPVAALAAPGSASIAPTIPAVPAAAAATMPRRV